ncbi:OmpP1/FadL family transporter [Pseudomonas sp. NPDC077186]|uniref:OmpP1/FadL family transporter n=1 Tax=Pseudomonas sp. NPDC077186 TaxID=3364421 RepID=UPI0037C520E2
MSKRLLQTGLAMAIAATSSHGLASGFAINEQSVSAMGTAFAGRSSAADDATTVFGNPAGMARLEREQVSGGLAAIIAKSDIDDAESHIPGSNDGDMVPFVAAPMGYYVKPLDEQWRFGFGLYVPFGLVTDYERNFQGRGYANLSEVRVITLQPTLSYRFNEQWSVGFGPTFNHVEGQLTSTIPDPFVPSDAAGQVKVKGDDFAMGFNAGVLFELNAATRFGLTYHSKVDYKLKGDTRIESDNLMSSAAGKYDASLELQTPESVDFSVTHALNDRWTLYAGSTWTRWSRLQEITVQSKGITGPLNPILTTITEEQGWHDTWAHAVGAAYQLNKQWVLRAGVAVDQSPTNNRHRSPRIPTGDRTIFSVGAGWSPNDDLTLDLAYSYLMEEDAKIDLDEPLKGSYRATYRNSAHGLGAQVTYRY